MSLVDKKKLKTVFLRKRKSLTEEEYDKRNAKLFYLFSQLLETKNPSVVHVFLPIEKQREVDTWIIIKYLRALQIKVVVSRMVKGENNLEHFVFENKNQLVQNELGIFEPTQGEKINEDALDMILVPLIVFDQSGHRIGYGKGYYDNFLSKCRADSIKIGLSLLTPLDKIPYIENHDIPLDYCISPVGIHSFNTHS